MTDLNSPRYWINGRATAELALDDRGLHYGDGVFSTIAVEGGQLLLMDAHLQRLVEGCQRLGFASIPDSEMLRSHAQAVVEKVDRAALKIIVTRGGGGRGYRSPGSTGFPTWIMGCYPWPAIKPRCQSTGVDVRLCTLRLSHQSRLAGVKHLNRLEQVIARSEWNDEHDEGLMLDQDGTVVEGTMSNLFLLRDGRLVTPLLDRAGVRGVMRDVVLRVAAELGINVEQRRVSIAELYHAAEMFLTNCIIGIWPVKSIDEHRLRPGPVTRKLQEALRDTHVVVIA